MRLQYDVIDHMPHVRGQFGCAEVRVWPVTFGANEKGGMDSEVFEKYIMNSIVPLYPHARNQRDKRVMLKVDSGPGRMNLQAQTLGFLIVPLRSKYNARDARDTSVTQFLENLDLICKA